MGRAKPAQAYISLEVLPQADNEITSSENEQLKPLWALRSHLATLRLVPKLPVDAAREAGRETSQPGRRQTFPFCRCGSGGERLKCFLDARCP